MTCARSGSTDLALGELADAITLWRLQMGGSAAEVVDAATQCLVVGLDSPTLRELAGESPAASYFVLVPLLSGASEELGLTWLDEREIHPAALKVVTRRFADGRMSSRELAAWAHDHLGFDSPSGGRLAVLAAEYEDLDHRGVPADPIDRRVTEEASAILEGRATSPQVDRPASTPVRRSGQGLGHRLRRWLGRR